MVLLTIDSVVRSALVTLKKPIHYYVRFLHYAMKCTNELKLGTLQVTKTVRLTVDAYGEVTIPTDYVDWVRIGYERGRYVVPLGEKRSINRLPKLDGDGNQTTYPSAFVTTSDTTWSYYPSYHYNEYQEHLGKYFGHNDSYRGDVFQVIPERSRIHLGSELTEGDEIVLEYLYFDSTSTQSLISQYAADTIENYIIWRFLKHSTTSHNYDINEAKDDYYNSYRKLLARMNPITKEMILRITRKNLKQSIKT